MREMNCRCCEWVSVNLRLIALMTVFVLNGQILATELPDDASKIILFFGDSLTAGYGVEKEEAFPALIQSRIDSLELQYEVVNAGLSGETSAGGLRRIDWVLRQPIDLFVLALGANDGLRGIDLKTTRANLQAIVDKVRKKYPLVQLVVVGMQMPPNFGPDYTKTFREIFPKLAAANRAELVPFLLKGVVLVPDEERLFRANHPTAEGHKILAENVWEVIEPLTREDSRSNASKPSM